MRREPHSHRRVHVTTALVVVSKVGADIGKFPSDKHFTALLGLCQGTKITGNKVMSGNADIRRTLYSYQAAW